MKFLSLALLLVILPLSASAEEIVPIPHYVEMSVLSCTPAMPLIEQKIKSAGYTAREKEETRISAQYMSLFSAQTLQEVEYITATFAGSINTYKGQVRPLKKMEKRQFMLAGVNVASCEKYYRGTTQVFSVTENFSCSREFTDPKLKVTVAECLTGVPLAHGTGVKASEMKTYSAH